MNRTTDILTTFISSYVGWIIGTYLLFWFTGHAPVPADFINGLIWSAIYTPIYIFIFKRKKKEDNWSSKLVNNHKTRISQMTSSKIEQKEVSKEKEIDVNGIPPKASDIF